MFSTKSTEYTLLVFIAVRKPSLVECIEKVYAHNAAIDGAAVLHTAQDLTAFTITYSSYVVLTFGANESVTEWFLHTRQALPNSIEYQFKGACDHACYYVACVAGIPIIDFSVLHKTASVL